jgi:hypothetical protein
MQGEDKMRFSIRDLLWATLVVAVGLAWWMEYRAHGETENKRLVTDAKRLEAVGQAHRFWGVLMEARSEVTKARNRSQKTYLNVRFPDEFFVPLDWSVLDERLVEP